MADPANRKYLETVGNKVIANGVKCPESDIVLDILYAMWAKKQGPQLDDGENYMMVLITEGLTHLWQLCAAMERQ